MSHVLAALCYAWPEEGVVVGAVDVVGAGVKLTLADDVTLLPPQLDVRGARRLSIVEASVHNVAHGVHYNEARGLQV